MKQLPIVRLMVILELLKAKTKKSGYEMFKRSPFSHQGLYKELRKLSSADCVMGCKVSQDGKPDKIVYSISNRQKLMDYVVEALAQNVDINSVRPVDIDIVMSFKDFIDNKLILMWLVKFKPQIGAAKIEKWKIDHTLSIEARKTMVHLIEKNIKTMERVVALRNLEELQAVSSEERTAHNCV